jgi:pre-60S factor REI1
MKFTCITCQVGFSGLEQQKIHYASDWHTYNLKRKIALLPPVDADTFYQKVTAIQDSVVPEANTYCHVCK